MSSDKVSSVHVFILLCLKHYIYKLGSNWQSISVYIIFFSYNITAYKIYALYVKSVVMIMVVGGIYKFTVR